MEELSPNRSADMLNTDILQEGQLGMLGTAFTGFDNQNSNEDVMVGTRLSASEMTAVWKLAQKNPVVSAMLSRLKRSLFSCGFEIYWGDKKMEPTKSFERILSVYWIKFAKDILMNIVTLGLVPVTIRQLRNTDIYYPVVPKPGTYVITQRYNHREDRCQYIFYRTFHDSDMYAKKNRAWKRDRSVHVLSGFGMDPCTLGTLTSPLASLLRDVHMQSLISRYEIMKTYRQAYPVFYTEPPEPKGVEAEGEERDQYYGDMEPMLNRQEAMIRRNETQRMIAMENRQMNEEFFMAEKLCSDDPVEELPFTFPLPAGHHLAAPATAPARSDFVSLMVMMQEKIGAVLGVPRSFIMHNEVSNRGGNESGTQQLSESLNSTVSEWMCIINDVLTTMYDVVYGEYDKEALGNVFSGKVLSGKVTKKNLFRQSSSKPEYRVRMVLAHSPKIEFDDVMRLNELGIVDWDTSKSLVASSLMLSKSMIRDGAQPKQPLTDQAKPKARSDKPKARSETATQKKQ